MRLLLVIAIILLLGGCGYKPSAKYAREVLGEKISTNVIISAQDPENTVIIKDAVDSAIITIFHASLVERKYAQTHLELQLSEPTYTPLQYNGDGFVIAYRATIRLGIKRVTQDMQKNYTTTGTYDFAIDPNAVLTEQQRFDAIRFSALKAISAFVAVIAAEGSQLHRGEDDDSTDNNK